MIRAKEHKDKVYRTIGAAMKVYDTVGYGLLEAVYQECLDIELDKVGLEHRCEEEIDIYYGDTPLKKKYRMDIVVGDVVVELKSVSKINSAHRAQLCNYLRLTNKPVGVLINFGASKIQGERWALDYATRECILVDMAMEPVYLDYDPFADGTIEELEE